LGLEFRFR
jgi:hypothetical protein